MASLDQELNVWLVDGKLPKIINAAKQKHVVLCQFFRLNWEDGHPY